MRHQSTAPKPTSANMSQVICLKCNKKLKTYPCNIPSTLFPSQKLPTPYDNLIIPLNCRVLK